MAGWGDSLGCGPDGANGPNGADELCGCGANGADGLCGCGGGRWWVVFGVGDLFYGVGGRSMKSMWQVTS